MFEQKKPARRVNQKRFDAIPGRNDRVFYFMGCTEKSYPGINAAFLEICKQLGTPVDTSNKQSCCTGNFLAFNTAPLETVLAITQRNYNVMRETSTRCITSCNGCFSSFHNANAYMKEKDVASGVEDVMKSIGMNVIKDVDVIHAAEFLHKHVDAFKTIAKRTLAGLKVAVHYGCHFLHQEDPAVILENVENPGFLEELLRVLGADVVEYKERLACCGAGLNQRILHEDRINSLRITRRKMASIKTQEPDVLIVVCPYCEIHLDNAQAELEVEFEDVYDIPVLHLNELIGILLDLPAHVLQLETHKVPVEKVLRKLGYDG